MNGTEQTYLALLLLLHSALRMRLQPELANCRDTLAFLNDRDVESIQNAYEALAAGLLPFIAALPEAALRFAGGAKPPAVTAGK